VRRELCVLNAVGDPTDDAPEVRPTLVYLRLTMLVDRLAPLRHQRDVSQVHHGRVTVEGCSYELVAMVGSHNSDRRLPRPRCMSSAVPLLTDPDMDLHIIADRFIRSVSRKWLLVPGSLLG
jgi:hypothetical protein